MTNAEHDKDMIESIEMWLHEIVPKWVEKELAWLEELRTRLLEEKSEIPKDLEEAAEESWQNSPDKGIYDEYSPFYKDGFIAGAEWQREQMISALKNDGDLPIEFIDKFHEIDRTAFQNGQANMKEQMMKEAVESTVTTNLANRPTIYYDQLQGFKYGDKVKIIIVKED